MASKPRKPRAITVGGKRVMAAMEWDGCWIGFAYFNHRNTKRLYEWLGRKIAWQEARREGK